MDHQLSNSKVVVTGGTGFIGTHVVEALRAVGADVFVARHDEYDLTRQADAARLFEEHPADVVFHLAGHVGGIGANAARPADFFYRNLTMGTFVLHEAWRAGARQLVAAGAGCGYPEHAPTPLRERSFWDGPPQAESAPYSLAKRMLHVQAQAYWRQHGFPVVLVVPGNVYGPRDNFDLDDAHVIPALVRKFVEAADDGLPSVTVWGSGKPVRDFIYVADVARGMLRAAERCAGPALLNLASGRGTSIAEVVAALREITAYPGTVVWDDSRPDGQARRVFDVSLAQKKLGFSAATPLRDGLAATAAWYRRHRGRQSKHRS